MHFSERIKLNELTFTLGLPSIKGILCKTETEIHSELPQFYGPGSVLKQQHMVQEQGPAPHHSLIKIGLEHQSNEYRPSTAATNILALTPPSDLTVYRVIFALMFFLPSCFLPFFNGKRFHSILRLPTDNEGKGGKNKTGNISLYIVLLTLILLL